MTSRERFLGIAFLLASVYGRSIVKYTLFSAMLAIVLAIVFSIVTSALLLGISYAGYIRLLASGIEPWGAMLIVATSVLVFFLFVFWGCKIYIRSQLRQMPRLYLAERASVVIDAFFDGLAGHRTGPSAK